MKVLITLLAIIGFAIALPLYFLYLGWATAALWTWYLVPLGVTPLTPVHAVGVSLLLHLLITPLYFAVANIPTTHSDSPAEDCRGCYVVIGVLTAPVVLWFLGWIGHFYM